MSHTPSTRYSWVNILMADPVKPTPLEKRTYQLTRMWQALADLELAPRPALEDWRLVSDAVNLLETLVTMGECEDTQGLLADAVAALAGAGERYHQHGTIRLDAPGILATRAVLEDYAELLAILPERTMVRCHMFTDKRVRDIQRGKKKPHDVTVKVVAL
jgi:hypothetical protein